MTVSQVYKKFMTPKNLQSHMLRVAALATIISNSWKKDQIDKNVIVKACLLHDIAKPMTFDPDKQKIFGMSDDEIIKLKAFQRLVQTKYDKDEHAAAVKIARELNLDTGGIRIMENLEWHLIPKVIEANDVESAIVLYCDMRIAPDGIMPLGERLADLKRREPTKDHANFQKNGVVLEKRIRENVSVDLNSISDEQINSLFAELLNSVF